MNNIEQVIWATVFAKKYQERMDDPPSWVGRENKYEQWESDSVLGAAEDAGSAIEALKRHGKKFIEGWDGCGLDEYMKIALWEK